MRVNIPIYPAKIHIKYTGRRSILNNIYTTFSNVGIEFEKEFESNQEPISVKIELFDGTEFYLGLISRKIYYLRNNKWIQNENGYLIHHEIILSDSITFLKGIITFDIEFNEEIINETYLFKLFINSGKRINSYILNSEIEYENFEK